MSEPHPVPPIPPAPEGPKRYIARDLTKRGSLSHQSGPPIEPLHEAVQNAPGHLTVVETVYFQIHTEQPTCCETRWMKAVSADEQPYARRFTLGPGWVPLDTGWLGDRPLACVVLANAEKVGGAILPTPEERAAHELRVIEIAFADPNGTRPVPAGADLVVGPGESVRFQPAPGRQVFLRCASGTAKGSLNLFPL